MSQVPSTSTNFGTLFTDALKEYKKQTKKDVASHPLATQLKSCDSSSAILAILRSQVQTFDQSQGADEKWTKWLDPTVNVLFAFSATLGNSVGVVFPPANAIFTGIGILLQAIKDVRASNDALIDLFGRMEFFFKRLEAYIKVRPTAAMRDIIVKIMVEVISILGIVTKEIRQGRTKKYLKKLIGMKDVEDALQRLDKLTQEEARMAAAETLTITRGIDDKVKVVDERLEGVDERVQSVDAKVEGIDDKVLSVDSKVQGVDDKVLGVDKKIQGVDDKVLSVDSKVQDVDHKVGTVIQGVVETGAVIQQVFNQVSVLNRNELRKDLRKWIAPPDPSVNYNAASGTHHEGTASWCTEGNTHADWKASGSLLWIHGKPGSGKSILSSVIIRDIKSISDDGSAFLAYFYFDFKDTAKQDTRALLSSLLVQLSDQSDILCDAFFSLYSAHKRGSEQPTDDSLARCLKNMLTMVGQMPIYLIIDALDECPNDSGIPSSREKVLRLVKELVGLHHPDLRLCITSRPEFDIRTTLKPLATQQLSLHDENGQKQDIVDYVTSVVRSDERMKRWRDDDKNMVIEKLTEKADGMFRWVFCQLEVLRHCFPANLRRTLEELPKSLDETYKRILSEINNANWVHAYRLLQCLTVARRPLRVEELAEVLAFDLDTGGLPKLNTNWRWEDQEEAVLSACSSLVSVIIDDDSRVVQFSHFSVKEFLVSNRLSSCKEEVSQFHIPIEPSHAILAKACIGVLLYLDDRADRDSVDNIPLYRYTSEYWVAHAKFGNVESQIKDALDYFFDMDNPHFSAWVRIELPHDFLRVSINEEPKGVPRPAAPLYFAAGNGFHGLLQRLIIKHPQQINQLGGYQGTPLHASVQKELLEVSRLLFAHGADINSRCADNWTPLHIASSSIDGHHKILMWLLDHGADVNSQQHEGSTPLHLATSGGHLEACRMLLERNANVNSRNDEGLTPLFGALNRIKHIDIVQLLLDHNADTHVHDNAGNAPLHLAAKSGRLEVVRILLKCKTEVNTRNNGGYTPLFLALKSGHADVTLLLLDHDVDVLVHDNNGNTPLHLAAEKGLLEVARKLLECNAQVDSRNNDGSTPLLFALTNENHDVARLLLDHNADAHVHDSSGHTPLHVAASKGYIEVARRLLERNAETDARINDGSTPLLLALKEGYADVALLFLDHKADAQVEDNSGNTPLEHATRNGFLEVARTLLERNAEVNSRNHHGSTPLLLASELGHKEVVQLLLDHNADLDVRDADGNSPLHCAAHGGRLEVVRILLKHHVEVNSRNNMGLTPLHRASMSSEEGSTGVVRLLLDYGADVRARNLNEETASEVACGPEQQEILRLLSQHAAE